MGYITWARPLLPALSCATMPLSMNLIYQALVNWWNVPLQSVVQGGRGGGVFTVTPQLPGHISGKALVEVVLSVSEALVR